MWRSVSASEKNIKLIQLKINISVPTYLPSMLSDTITLRNFPLKQNNTVSTHLTPLTIGHFHWMTMSNCQLSSKTNEWLAHNITRSFYSNNPNEWTEKSPAWTDVFWLDKYKLIWSTTWSERAVKMCQAPSVQTPHKHCENSVISEKNALRTGSVIHEHYL